MPLPPMPLAEMVRRINTLRVQRREKTTNLLREVGRGSFWTVPRYVQVMRMVARNEAHGVFQTDIATILGVSDGLVSRLKQRQLRDPDETPRSQDGQAN